MAGDAEEYFMLSSRTNVRDLPGFRRSLTFVRDDKVLLTYQQTFSASPRLAVNISRIFTPFTPLRRTQGGLCGE